MLIVDETSDLHAKDFVIPPFSPGQRVLVVASDRPENNGIFVLTEDGFHRLPLTERDAPQLPIWARNDNRR